MSDQPKPTTGEPIGWEAQPKPWGDPPKPRKQDAATPATGYKHTTHFDERNTPVAKPTTDECLCGTDKACDLHGIPSKHDKPATIEWTAADVLQMGCDRADPAYAIADAHNAALAAAIRSQMDKDDEMWSAKLDAERDLRADWNYVIEELEKKVYELTMQLAAERSKVLGLVDALTLIKTMTVPTNECHALARNALSKVKEGK